MASGSPTAATTPWSRKPTNTRSFLRRLCYAAVVLGLAGLWAIVSFAIDKTRRETTDRLPETTVLPDRSFEAEKQQHYPLSGARQPPLRLAWNEIWTNSEAQDHRGAHQHTGMSDHEIHADPHLFLTSAHSEICAEAISDGTIPDTCGGQCTIVIKMFDKHTLPHDGIVSLMKDSSMHFVVLERDVGNEYCSRLRAVTLDDWGTTPGGHKKDLPRIDCDDVPREFALAHEEWFDFVRQELRLNRRSFVDVPFALVASCGLRELAGSIYAMHGFALPMAFEWAPDIGSLFSDCDEV